MGEGSSKPAKSRDPDSGERAGKGKAKKREKPVAKQQEKRKSKDKRKSKKDENENAHIEETPPPQEPEAATESTQNDAEVATELPQNETEVPADSPQQEAEEAPQNEVEEEAPVQGDEGDMADGIDPQFKTIPKGSTCFIIWRVENFELHPVPKDKYGHFFDGDSYIVYAATNRSGDVDLDEDEVREVKGQLDMRVHFWLGENTTQDEAGTAAIKAVELDDYLGGTPIQYREVQGRESKIFLNYFRKKGGIKYKPGGVQSGFTHVDNTIENKLYHIKGKHHPRIREVPIEWSSMNWGDAYILDGGEVFFVWLGRECSRTERIKAMEYARKLRDDRGKGNLEVVEDQQETRQEMGDAEYQIFNELLPKDKKGDLKSAEAGGADETYERKATSDVKLYKCREEDGKLEVTEIASKPLKREMLDTDDTFIIDNGTAGIWVWCGRKATKNEKRAGMTNANAFIQKKGYPKDTPVVKIHENAEPTEFKALFKVWDREKLPGEVEAYKPNRIAPRMLQTKFDASTLHSNPSMARDTGMVDDGSGAKKIWRVEKQDNGMYDIEELPAKYYGQLYGGDSYIIQYTYPKQTILYYWLGKKSTADERGVAARKTVELDDSMNGQAKQVRVVHGKEPNHFLSMFDGKLIIFQGGKAGWGQDTDEGPGDTYLLHVRGTSSINTKAEQVPCSAESLNSNDVFVLFSEKTNYVWAGKGSTGDEREMAKNIAGTSPRGYKLLTEGKETKDFWELLGGKQEYSSAPRLSEENSDHPPRLFQCSNASGVFSVEEIIDFTQQDLVPDDVFILDTYDNVFVWIGDECRPEEKTQAMDTAVEYIETDPSGRDEGTPVFLIKQGLEPPDFVGYFGVWDRDLWSSGKSFSELKQELGEQNVAIERVDKEKVKRHSSRISNNAAVLPPAPSTPPPMRPPSSHEPEETSGEPEVNHIDAEVEPTESPAPPTPPPEADNAQPPTPPPETPEPETPSPPAEIPEPEPTPPPATAHPAVVKSVSSPTSNGTAADFDDCDKHPIAVLRDRDSLPSGVDVSHREKHLSSPDFEEAFGMSYSQFAGLPKWKQERKKKELGLW